MSLVVQKYGGTSVATLERIEAVAARIARTRAAGHDVVVVVSAMSGETNRLLQLGRQLAPKPEPREMDALVATGEQVSSALLAIALSASGVPARSLVGHQMRLQTDDAFTKARIVTIDDERIRAVLREGRVVVVAGFQGVDEAGNITTLGRGGSDTTAVAIAAALDADVCEIYTDVDGVYTADPRVCPNARKIDRISYEEMLELASLGAKVLQIRSVEVAMKYGVPVHVRSSFSEAEGTMVTNEDAALESVVVTGVTSDHNTAKVTIRALVDRPGIAAAVFEALAQRNVSVDMIIQNVSEDERTDLTFTVAEDDAQSACEIAAHALVDKREVLVDSDVVKVSIVGLGMRTHAGIAARMFRLLGDASINIQAISTSEIKVSCLIEAQHAEAAVRVLHDGFQLGG